jgi:hypothetical protein
MQFYIIFFQNPVGIKRDDLENKFKPDDDTNQVNINKVEHSDQELNSVVTRDFKRYKCANRIRVGGMKAFVQATQDKLYRIDGAYFLCMDEGVRPEKNQCTVLSFGINWDESFDVEMDDKYGCQVHSFDPNVGREQFKNGRRLQKYNELSRVIDVNNKRHLYNIGLIGVSNNKNLFTIEQIYEFTGTRNKVIDVWKMDIEGYERDVFEKLDIDYVCKYVKQLMFETHWVV